MTVNGDDLSEQDQELGAVIFACVQALEGGQSAEEVVARHPHFAGELRAFFAGRGCVERLALPVRTALQSPYPPDSGPSVPAQLGEFRIVREIGRGGMGMVYEAEQLSLNRRVALKVLPFAATLDPRQLQRFRNEAQAAAMLHHSNIVPIHAVGC